MKACLRMDPEVTFLPEEIQSVPDYTPVIVKDNKGFIDCLSISELWKLVESPVQVNVDAQNELKVANGLEVYVGYRNRRWSKIRHISRHFYRGKLLRINTVGGIVDASPNHSVFLRCGRSKSKTRLVDAKEVKAGDRIVCRPFVGRLGSARFFLGTEDLGWLYGFFAAEGSAYYVTPQHPRYEASFANKRMDLLLKVERILRENFHVKTRWNENKGTHKLSFISKPFYEFFKENSYVGKEKRVPKTILNAPQNIQLAFLRGYNDGNGEQFHNPKRNWEFRAFTSTSWPLMQGLLILLSNVTKQAFTVHSQDDEEAVKIRITKSTYAELKSNPCFKDREIVRSIKEIEYEGYLYDLSTENEMFITGVGGIRVHNTGYTMSTNATYMKTLEAKGLLWEASKKGRKAFRNRFPYWVAENIRKIRPNAPDGAIDEIVDRLKRSVIGG